MIFLYVTRNILLDFRILKRKKKGVVCCGGKKSSQYLANISFITGITIKFEFNDFPEEETNDYLASNNHFHATLGMIKSTFPIPKKKKRRPYGPLQKLQI